MTSWGALLTIALAVAVAGVLVAEVIGYFLTRPIPPTALEHPDFNPWEPYPQEDPSWPNTTLPTSTSPTEATKPTR